MGYTTSFDGEIRIEPPLSSEEREYLTKFADTRRMACKQGPYYVDRGGFKGQDNDTQNVENYNEPAAGQPSLWCQWVPSDDGTSIEWDGNEKFYAADQWMKYLIDHFIGGAPLARAHGLTFLTGHTCNGEIEAQGEDSDDRWQLIVVDNKVYVRQGTVVYGEPSEIE